MVPGAGGAAPAPGGELPRGEPRSGGFGFGFGFGLGVALGGAGATGGWLGSGAVGG
ncbi:hypothetical protein SUDANB95_01504 [Actinosynnema sp. ALI-1.44]